MIDVLAFTVFCAMASAQADQLDTAVRANYPTALTQAATRFHYTDLKQQAYTSVPVAGGTYVVAAYSNGHVGAVVLLEQSTGGLKMDDALFGAMGKDPEIKLRDVDADGNNDAVVVYNTGRGSETWIVAINGGKFVVMNPVEKEGHTLLSHPHLVDLGRNGAVDLVDVSVSGRGEDAVANYTHYVLANGKYIEAQPLDFYQIFYREKGQPVTQEAEFDVPANLVGKPFHLIVGNGGQSGPRLRVAAGTISLNGTVVSPPSDFSESRGSWSVPVVLQEHNTMAVRLDGKAASRIAVAVVHD